MISYAHMTDAEIKEYREKSIKEAKEKEEKWKKKHPNGVNPSYRTPLDEPHHISYPMD